MAKLLEVTAGTALAAWVKIPAQAPTKSLPPIVATVSSWNEKALLRVFKGTRLIAGRRIFVYNLPNTLS